VNPNVVNVTTADDLERILAADRRHAHRVVLALDALAPEERIAWERRINSNFRACGCGSAALALVAAFLVGGAVAVFHHELLTQRPLVVSAVGLLMLLAALGLGKAAGLWIARVRLRSAVASLQRRIVSA